MTAVPHASAPPRAAFLTVLAQARAASPALFNSAALMLVLWLACLGLEQVDGHLLNGINIWVKPAKFFLSLGVHLTTVAWAMSLLTPAQRATRGSRIGVTLLVACAWAEMAYLVFRSARGEASHFNIATPAAQIAYALMGLGAVTMTGVTAVVGVRLLRTTSRSLWTEAAGLGLTLGALLGTLAGIYVSQGTGHWVGGDQSDATGTGFFYWSTTGGDLRIAHFVGLHACQIIPLAALSGRRRMVWGTALVITLLTAFVFIQAVMGVPLFRQ
jgi:hypothetical protein